MKISASVFSTYNNSVPRIGVNSGAPFITISSAALVVTIIFGNTPPLSTASSAVSFPPSSKFFTSSGIFVVGAQSPKISDVLTQFSPLPR